MGRHNGSTITFNAATPRDKGNDMIFTFTLVGPGVNDQVFAPLGINPEVTTDPPTITDGTTFAMNEAGTFHGFYMRGDADAATATESYTVQKNSSNTAVTGSTTVGQRVIIDNTHSFSVTAGDEINIICGLTGAANFGAISGGLTFIPA